MKRLMIGASIIALLTSPVAMARPDNNRDQQHESRRDDNNHRNNVRHSDNGRHLGWAKNRGHNYHWGRGQRMGYNDWSNTRRIDYRRYNLRQPQRGYEWRRNDDRFILVAVATGLIISVILSNGR